MLAIFAICFLSLLISLPVKSGPSHFSRALRRRAHFDRTHNAAIPVVEIRGGVSVVNDKTDGHNLAMLKSLGSKTASQFRQEGWISLATSSFYSVYQKPLESDPSLAQFLIIANFEEASPRAMLFAYMNSSERRKWDSSIKDIYSLSSNNRDDGKRITYGWSDIKQFRGTVEDIFYYRAKCPWPLKDRDYVTFRSCTVLEDEKIVIVHSNATNDPRVGLTPSGVQRMSKYSCTNAFISTNVTNGSLDTLGTKYISLSTDEQVVGSVTVLNIINSVATRMINDYMNKLAAVGKSIQTSVLQ